MSRSAYYEWGKTRDEREKAAKVYAEAIRKIFTESGGTYGVERVCAELRKKGFTASFHRVRDNMAEQDLKSIHLRHRQRWVVNILYKLRHLIENAFLNA